MARLQHHKKTMGLVCSRYGVFNLRAGMGNTCPLLKRDVPQAAGPDVLGHEMNLRSCYAYVKPSHYGTPYPSGIGKGTRTHSHVVLQDGSFLPEYWGYLFGFGGTHPGFWGALFPGGCRTGFARGWHTDECACWGPLKRGILGYPVCEGPTRRR